MRAPRPPLPAEEPRSIGHGRSSTSAPKKLRTEPTALESAELANSRLCLPRRLAAQMVEKRGSGHEPAGQGGKAFDNMRETRVWTTVLGEAEAEVRIRDACASLFDQTVLLFVRQERTERVQACRVARAEPETDVRSTGVVVRHEWIGLQRVHMLEAEVPDVLDPIATEVTPEIRRVFDVTEVPRVSA